MFIYRRLLIKFEVVVAFINEPSLREKFPANIPAYLSSGIKLVLEYFYIFTEEATRPDHVIN